MIKIWYFNDSLGIPSAGTIAFFSSSPASPSFFAIFHVRGHMPIPAPISLSSEAASYTSTDMCEDRERMTASMRPPTPAPLFGVANGG